MRKVDLELSVLTLLMISQDFSFLELLSWMFQKPQLILILTQAKYE